MSRLLPSGLLAVALAASGAAAASGEIYRWTDEQGVSHYSDTPPPNQEHVTVKVAVAAQPETDLDPDEPVETPAAPVAPEPKLPTTLSNCETARKNLETFSGEARVVMDRDGDGKPEPLDETQRAAEIARNEELVRIFCE
jgi:hypothetical protein